MAGDRVGVCRPRRPSPRPRGPGWSSAVGGRGTAPLTFLLREPGRRRRSAPGRGRSSRRGLASPSSFSTRSANSVERGDFEANDVAPDPAPTRFHGTPPRRGEGSGGSREAGERTPRESGRTVAARGSRRVAPAGRGRGRAMSTWVSAAPRVPGSLPRDPKCPTRAGAAPRDAGPASGCSAVSDGQRPTLAPPAGGPGRRPPEKPQEDARSGSVRPRGGRRTGRAGRGAATAGAASTGPRPRAPLRGRRHPLPLCFWGVGQRPKRRHRAGCASRDPAPETPAR